MEEIGFNLPEEDIRELLYNYKMDEYKTIDYIKKNKEMLLKKKNPPKESPKKEIERRNS